MSAYNLTVKSVAKMYLKCNAVGVALSSFFLLPHSCAHPATAGAFKIFFVDRLRLLRLRKRV